MQLLIEFHFYSRNFNISKLILEAIKKIY